MKRNAFRLLKIIVAISVFTGLLLVLNSQVTQTQKSQEHFVQKQESRLDVAIVNEDQGSDFEGKVYNLAQSYVKQLEKDTSHNWFVVSRSTADSGLEKGTYQLVVFIPNNFTKKLLDINSLTPEKTTVTYKVNASGNATVENLANRTGSQIITDLNQQLVDMFMASILGNLYTAQQNVKSVIETQDRNIGYYQTSIYDNALNFRSGLPSLFEHAQSSWASNDQLISNLTETGTLYEALETGQTSYSSQLTKLLEQRASGQLNQADFVAQLLEMSDLVIENANLYDSLRVTQDDLLANFSLDDSELLTTTTTAQSQLETLLTELQTQKEALEEQLIDDSSSVASGLKTYYGIEENLDELTMAKFLEKYGDSSWQDFQRDMETVDTVLAAVVSKLPSHEIDRIEELLAYSSESLPEGYDPEKVALRFPEAGEDRALYDFLKAAYDDLDYQKSVIATEEKRGKIVLDNSEGAFDQLELRLSSSSDAIIIDDTSYESELGNLPDEVVTLSFTYHVVEEPVGETDVVGVRLIVPGKAPETETTTERIRRVVSVEVPSNDGSAPQMQDVDVDVENIRVTETSGQPAFAISFEIPVDFSSFASKAYQDRLSVYNNAVGRTVQAYETVQVLVDTLPERSLMSRNQDFLNQSVSDYLTDLVLSLLSPAVTEHQENLQTLDTSIVELETSLTSLASQLETLKGQSEAASTTIDNLLGHYQTLSQKVAELQDSQTSNTSHQDEFSTQLESLSQEFEGLRTGTQGVALSTQQHLMEAETIKSTLDSFENNITIAESSAETLSVEAERLMVAFNEELSKNQDFVGAFVKVLNNAYNDGVPNEVLLDFLSDPVREESQATKVTTNVYKPFTWILLIEVISLLTAYLFSNSRIFKTSMDKFAKATNPLLSGRAKTVIVQQLFSLLLGLFIGLVSFKQLNLEERYAGLWVIAVTLITLFLTQIQYILLKYLKASGMGVALFFFVSYIYLTSAIGTTATVSGFPLFMRRINLLSFFESLLSGFFVERPVSPMHIILLTFFLFLAIAFGLFIRPGTNGGEFSEGES